MNNKPLPSQITIGDKYGPAMEIDNQIDADQYFERLVVHGMSRGKTRKQAEALERTNLEYYAGYYSATVAKQVYRLFRCAHPIFGTFRPDADEALNTGRKAGQAAIATD